MFTTHTDHVVSVDDAEYSLPSSPFGSTRLPTSSNGVSSCPSPASSLSSLPDSPSLSPLTLPSEREPPSPVPAIRGAGSASNSTSTTKTHTRRVTRSRIPKVRILKLGGMASSAAPKSKSDAGSATSQEAGTIPKPEGENGRPNRGGYTLSKILGWNTKEYREAQVCSLIYAHIPHLIFRQTFAAKIVRETLPSNVPFTSQHPEKLTIVREKVCCAHLLVTFR